MSYVSKDYRAIADAILSQISNGEVEQAFTYLPDGGEYVLSYSEQKAVIKVEGSMDGYPHVFTKDVDYLVSDHRLKWLQGSKPDENTSFLVHHVTGTPVEITDVNPGSVVRTIIESIAVEMGFLYAQMDAVYDSSFIDTAEGQALDLVVAMLGVSRKPAEHAAGDVIFGRHERSHATGRTERGDRVRRQGSACAQEQHGQRHQVHRRPGRRHR